MSKAFTKEDDGATDQPVDAGFPQLQVGVPNRITPVGRHFFLEELARLEAKTPLEPWEAARLATLRGRADTWVVTEPLAGLANFGRAVQIKSSAGDDEARTFTVVGIDEASPGDRKISWLSPMGRALLNARPGDVVTVAAPGGSRDFDVLEG